MFSSVRQSRWSLIAVLLLLPGSLPRLGCVCPDGTELAVCPILVSQAFSQIWKAFAPKPETCSCCVHDKCAPEREDSNGSGPCGCELNFNGPQWSSSDRPEIPQTVVVFAVLEACDPGIEPQRAVSTLSFLTHQMPPPDI